MKKTFFLFLIIFALLIVGCSSKSGSNGTNTPETNEPETNVAEPKVEKREIDVALAFSDGDPAVECLKKFAELVDEKSNGSIVVNVHSGGVLGGERDNLENLRAGSLHMTASSSNADTIFFAPEYSILTTPFLLESSEQLKEIWEGPLGEEINSKMEKEMNLITLGLLNRGPRELTANTKVETPSDLSGLNIRLPENQVYIRVWESMGAQAVPVALPEVYGALQTGVVDGQENPLATINSNKFQEVQKYLMMTNHIFEMYKIQASKTWYDTLSVDEKNIIAECLTEAIKYGNEVVAESENTLKSELEAGGMTIVYPDMSLFIEKAQPTIEELGKSYFAEGLYEMFITE